MNESRNFVIYTMEVHILTEFHLQMTIMMKILPKKVILPNILPIVGPYVAQILSKIAKFEKISNLYDLKRGNTSTDKV